MIKILIIITSFLFLLNSAIAETFSTALKKAYKSNPELKKLRNIEFVFIQLLDNENLYFSGDRGFHQRRADGHRCCSWVPGLHQEDLPHPGRQRGHRGKQARL